MHAGLRLSAYSETEKDHLFAHAHPAEDAACEGQNQESDDTSTSPVCSGQRLVGPINLAVSDIAGVGVTLGGTSSLGRDRRRCVLHEERRNGSKDVHLLTGTCLAIIDTAGPLKAANTLCVSSSTLLDGSFG